MVRLLCLLATVLAAGEPGTELVLDLGGVDRVFRFEESGALTTVRLDRGKVSVAVEAREFLLRFADGTVVRPDDCTVAHCEPLPAELGPHGLTVVHEHPRFEIRVHYSGEDDRAFAFKQVAVQARGEAEPPVLQSVELEHWRGEFHGGGRGRPAFGNRLVAGIEHPAGEQVVSPGALTLQHTGPFTARRDESGGPWRYRSLPRVVFGAATDGETPVEVFRRYLATVRHQTTPQVVHRLDRPQGTLDLETIREEFDAVGRRWIQAADGRLHGLILESGWSSGAFRPDSEVFPAGLSPLGRSLADRRIGLGLGLPLDGPEWDPGRGHADLLADPTHRRAVLMALMERHRETPLSHVVHVVGADDLDAAAVKQVRAWVGAERRFSPELTAQWSGPSDSPWWLMTFDGRRETVPAPDPTTILVPFQDRLTREDQRVHRRMKVGFPASALEVEVDTTPPDEAGEWADLMMLRTGRGLHVLTLPANATTWADDTGTAVAATWSWARSRRTILDQPAVWFGGAPVNGAVYGYLHRGEDGAILVLRNPSPAAAVVDLPEHTSSWLQTYPCLRTLDQDAPLRVPGHTVLCLETTGAVRHLAEIPRGVRFQIGAQKARRRDFDLLLSAGETVEFEWLDTSTGATRGTSAAALSLGGGRRPPAAWEEPGNAHAEATASTLSWSIPDLLCYRGERTTLWLSVERDGLPDSAGGRLTVNAPADLRVAAGDGWRRWRVEVKDSPPDGVLEIRLETTGPWPRGQDHTARLVLRRTEHLEIATVAYAHGLRASREPVLPPAARAQELVDSRVLFEGPIKLTPKDEVRGSPQKTP